MVSAVRIESLDQEGHGVGRIEGKTVFVEGALPGETVEIRFIRRKPRFDVAVAERVLMPSAAREQPRCPFFTTCGGCAMQHLSEPAQVAAKQRALEDVLWHVGRVRPDCIYSAIHGPTWRYRHRARLSARLVQKKGGVLVGFHERRSSYVADMTSCEILPKPVSDILPELRALIGASSLPDRIPQVEVAVGHGTIALVFRILAPLTSADQLSFRRFSESRGVRIYLQPRGPDSVELFHPQDDRELLEYRLPEFGLALRFRPTDFTQVNHATNSLLVRRAMQLLAPEPGERVADLFCGLGNFTLPIARLGARVLGIEGSQALVDRAGGNAAANGLASLASFKAGNLFEMDAPQLASLGRFDKLLIDPPREGAIAVVKALGSETDPKRIVYVSCNPSTLARDAAVLCHEQGFRLAGVGLVNMFPHTAHVESIALFERK